ncbi:hypothetical protein SAMN04489724_4322 [Algoriphagus locisalis]|uniref:DUF4377 domain-containing protein n=1 Tax=Algoriphagus locisalis TaxID=305507 RepID=A0A1I7DR61_9BACT|nr:hypothetical protein [Algoriphagus locisalis]SFU14145.1 hypothetical protein SAMN04489724_4322 [Algoriphagus locisalis]
MKSLFILFIALLFFTSCADDPEPDGVLIRVENNSEVDFKDVIVNSGSGDVAFGTIRDGKKSNYMAFESAYRYGFVSLLADEKELRIQPRDYVGETPLEIGFYTYKLGVITSNTGSPNLTLELVIDN